MLRFTASVGLNYQGGVTGEDVVFLFIEANVQKIYGFPYILTHFK